MSIVFSHYLVLFVALSNGYPHTSMISTTIASLSLLAGVIIVANAVALAMLERRRELGILKSIGHNWWGRKRVGQGSHIALFMASYIGW